MAVMARYLLYYINTYTVSISGVPDDCKEKGSNGRKEIEIKSAMSS